MRLIYDKMTYEIMVLIPKFYRVWRKKRIRNVGKKLQCRERVDIYLKDIYNKLTEILKQQRGNQYDMGLEAKEISANW